LRCGIGFIESYVSVNVNAAASAAVADTRSPEQIKAELVELQRAIQEEANRFGRN